MIDGLLRLGAVLPEDPQYLDLQRLHEAVTGLALGLVLFSAFIHASWNFLLKKSGGGTGLITARLGPRSLVIYAPIVPALHLVCRATTFQPMHLALMFGSGMIHTVLLPAARPRVPQRRRPVDRLSARARHGPLLTIVVAVLMPGRAPGPTAIVGAVLIGASGAAAHGQSLRLAQERRAPRRGFALLTGCTIAGYTIFDKASVAAWLIPPLLYDWGCNFFRVIVLVPLARRRAPGRHGDARGASGAARVIAIALALAAFLHPRAHRDGVHAGEPRGTGARGLDPLRGPHGRALPARGRPHAPRRSPRSGMVLGIAGLTLLCLEIA